MQNDCEAVIIGTAINPAYKRCDFYASQCKGSPGINEEKWNRQSSSCPPGFSRFGTTNGCYRIAGEGCSWEGTWHNAEAQCTGYGPKVHLAGIRLAKVLGHTTTWTTV